MKINIKPYWKREDRADGGIRRIVEAQCRYLPDFGIGVTENEAEADLVVTHAAELAQRTDIPSVHQCHGFYFTEKWPAWADDVNKRVMESIARASAHVACSEWIADAIRRNTLAYPEIIHHGISVDDWPLARERQPYILWNKARVDLTCNPEPMNKLAKMLPKVQFVSTFGDPAPNVKLTGAMPYVEMKELIRNAGVYLVTSYETFGIGTLEALVSGVPVVGWAFGGQTEIIRQGETGYLVPPGDYEALAVAVFRCMKENIPMSKNARQDVVKRWQWPQFMKQYADLYKATCKWWNAMKPKVSIIIPAYNVEQYLGDTLRSVAMVEFEDWECIVVDDCSTDGTQAVTAQWCEWDKRISYYKMPKNSGTAAARNYGVAKSHGRYILPLDADDLLKPNALQVLVSEIEKRPGVHIVYGHMDALRDGKLEQTGWPPEQFSWGALMGHYNPIPYCALMKREVVERCGGYREREWQEDPDFWCRATSYGFRAEKVTQAPMFTYRLRPDSKLATATEESQWTAWYPWNQATKAGEIRPKDAAAQLFILPSKVPFGAQGKPRDKIFWPVRSYDHPKISVIIPVGAGHDKWLVDALDSLPAQTFQEWEAIVVNDTGKKWKDGFLKPCNGAPFAHVYSTGENKGTSAARNLGAKHARGEALLFLDADDYLLPRFMELCWNIYEQVEGGGIVYTDWLKDESENGRGRIEKLPAFQTNDFECGEILKHLTHNVTCLVPRKAHEAIGGFDTNIPFGWENWDYLIAMQAQGVCSYRVPEPLFVYRFASGKRRKASLENRETLIKYLHDKWSDYYEGRKTMACGGCGSRTVRSSAKAMRSNGTPAPLSDEAVMLEYTGPEAGPLTFRGKVSRKPYRFGLDGSHRRAYVHAEDAPAFLEMTKADGKPRFVRVK